MTNNDVSWNCFYIEEPPINIEPYKTEETTHEESDGGIDCFCIDTSTWD
ncbi:MAG: hypothetical protein IK085_08710 [Clostridia bacterium]|nr:hypothetical protein [Clostridia bacterium]